jgi:hypothetical protein
MATCAPGVITFPPDGAADLLGTAISAARAQFADKTSAIKTPETIFLISLRTLFDFTIFSDIMQKK